MMAKSRRLNGAFRLISSFIAFCAMLGCGVASEVIILNGKDLSLMRDHANVLGVANMRKNPDKYLKVTPITVVQATNEKACQRNCLADKNCLSINVAKPVADSKAKVRCELLSSDKFVSKQNLLDNTGYRHYSLKSLSCESEPCQNGGKCSPNYVTNNYTCICSLDYSGRNCTELKRWLLIARFSNADFRNWAQENASWWYDLTSPVGDIGNTATNADMISSRFWTTPGKEIKITRSDDPTNTALFRTTSNCLASKTFRGKIASFGDFRNGVPWSTNACLGTCDVVYGGQYQTTLGFEFASCDGDLQTRNKIGFFCHYPGGDAAVIMIGGGGSDCGRADHGIVPTEDDDSGFGTTYGGTYDFGYNKSPNDMYALNLWVERP